MMNKEAFRKMGHIFRNRSHDIPESEVRGIQSRIARSISDAPVVKNGLSPKMREDLAVAVKAHLARGDHGTVKGIFG